LAAAGKDAAEGCDGAEHLGRSELGRIPAAPVIFSVGTMGRCLGMGQLAAVSYECLADQFTLW